ncbi:hypothetical protein [Leeia oryzae]|uniref:hypothetical protein n=1 Tax=Leeia oryzae TaxID=356662 RepID=UPI00036D8B66|nr:hypothetical protein [Leeia oryzae]
MTQAMIKKARLDDFIDCIQFPAYYVFPSIMACQLAAWYGAHAFSGHQHISKTSATHPYSIFYAQTA